MRRTLDKDIQEQVYHKYNSKCYICNYSITEALVIHHIIPLKYLGKHKDEIDNLVLLCSNCHKIVHRFSSEKYHNIKIHSHLSPELNNNQIKKIQELANHFIEFKKNVRMNGNVVKDPYSLTEAIRIVSRNNGFELQKKSQLRESLLMILNLIPKPISRRYSFRLLKKGKYISINLMNYLFFRTPGFGDFGEIPVHECLISFPEDKIPDRFQPIETREPFYFKHAEVVNIGLSFKELLNASTEEKWLFSKACEIFSSSRRTRDWVSNIDISKRISYK